MSRVVQHFIGSASFDVAALRQTLQQEGWSILSIDDEQWEETWLDGKKWPLLKAGLGCRVRKTKASQGYIVELGPVPRAPNEFCHQWQAVLNCPQLRDLPDVDIASVLEREFSLSTPEDMSERLRALVFSSAILCHDEGEEAQLIFTSLQATANRTEEYVYLRSTVRSEEAALSMSNVAQKLQLLPLQTSLLDHVVKKLDLGGRKLKKPPRPVVKEKDVLADVAQKVFRYHCKQMFVNEVGTRVGLDPEYLHDMRVATRRMRSAFGDFKACYQNEDIEFFTTELRWVADVLGQVRDLDVQITDLHDIEQQLDIDEDEFASILSLLEFRRQEARQSMLVELSSQRYASFVEKYKEFIERNPVRNLRAIGATVSAKTKAAEAARELLALRTEKVFKRGKKAVKNLCDERLHRLRIQCKKLRYLAEFFRTALNEELATSFIAHLIGLQDLIGEQHDSVVAIDRLQDVIEQLPEQDGTVETLQQLVEASRERAEVLRDKVPETFSQFKAFVESEAWQQMLGQS